MKRTVLITGATSGIGSETARRFAESGWDVICHYNTEDERLSRLEEALREYGGRSHFVKSDFSSEKDIGRFVKSIKKLTIDSIINNAGTYLAKKHFTELGVAELSKVFMVNAFAPIVISSAVFPAMVRRGFGRIVNVSSIAAKYGGSAYSMHYGSSKLALEGLTRTLAREGASGNVLVNTVRPGVIDTDFHRKFPKDMNKRISMIPMGRMGRPAEAAGLIYYLGSEENTFITNETIAVSGGE